ncbi:hypothetical protein KQI69_05015 [Eubacterium sp. MSJ-13]|uniref:hypothetical protein n=1 Tax=Eubacterium sp. MSJ-13 TaxID=2841513 RepID=UPI001C121599|nr:hypothetical protein [Eubacterium sp. MSJ-13]MBU5478560.1 hypothetical protein [Eubacterium sp. MSJ-13]
MFYKDARRQADLKLEDMTDTVNSKYLSVNKKLEDLKDNCKNIPFIINQVESFEGRISGTPQNLKIESRDLIHINSLVEQLNTFDHSLENNNQNKIFNSSNALKLVGTISPFTRLVTTVVTTKKNKDKCKNSYEKLAEMQDEYEQLKEFEILIEKKKRIIMGLKTKIYQYLIKLQNEEITDYKQFDQSQKSDFQTMILNVMTLKKELEDW